MSNGTSTVADRIRELIAAFVLTGAVASGAMLVGPEEIDTNHVRISAFNIQDFGKTKRGRADVMEVLVKSAQEFDVMVVQEIRDVTGQTPGIYLDQINHESEFTYTMFAGPRVGHHRKEQYVVYYIPALVGLRHAYTLPDDDDVFEREPLVTTLVARDFDFTLVTCHIKPDRVDEELRALEAAVDAIKTANPDEDDIILLGDFNANGDYLDEALLAEIFPPDRYHVLIDNEQDTMVKTDNTYDRIVVTTATFGAEYIESSAGVFRFDDEYGLDDDLARKVSDHYPVFAEFWIDEGDDDPT